MSGIIWIIISNLRKKDNSPCLVPTDKSDEDYSQNGI